MKGIYMNYSVSYADLRRGGLMKIVVASNSPINSAEQVTATAPNRLSTSTSSTEIAGFLWGEAM